MSEAIKAVWVQWRRGRIIDIRGRNCGGKEVALLPESELAEWNEGEDYKIVAGQPKKLKGKGRYKGSEYEVK
jgi:hypothetical protein